MNVRDVSRLPQAVGVALLFALLSVVALNTRWGLALDAWVMGAVSQSHEGFANRVDDWLQLLSVPLVLLVGGGALVLAWRHRRVVPTLRSVVAAGVAVATSEVLKVVLPGRPGDPVAPLSGPLDLVNPAWWERVRSGQVILGGSFPGGHATVATAVLLILATALGAARMHRLRLWPALAATAVGVAAATVMAGWHRPSDALGGILVALLWWYVFVPGETATSRGRSPVEPDSRAVVAASPLAHERSCEDRGVHAE